MGVKPTIDKETILETAWNMAAQEGLSRLSIRSLASACGVSVGSIYNYFPNKGELVAGIVDRFWYQAIAHDVMAFKESESFVAFCERVTEALSDAVSKFQAGWLGQIGSLDETTRKIARTHEAATWAHVQKALLTALENDKDVKPDALEGTTPEALCELVWGSIMATLRGQHGTANAASTLFALLRKALY